VRLCLGPQYACCFAHKYPPSLEISLMSFPKTWFISAGGKDWLRKKYNSNCFEWTEIGILYGFISPMLDFFGFLSKKTWQPTGLHKTRASYLYKVWNKKIWLKDFPFKYIATVQWLPIASCHHAVCINSLLLPCSAHQQLVATMQCVPPASCHHAPTAFEPCSGCQQIPSCHRAVCTNS